MDGRWATSSGCVAFISIVWYICMII